MKKTLVVAVFLLLMVATAVWTVIAAIDSYRFDMDPANGVDILEGLGAVLVVIVGGLIVLYDQEQHKQKINRRETFVSPGILFTNATSRGILNTSHETREETEKCQNLVSG